MIGISGFGFVGSALYNSIKNKSSTIIYDPNIEKFNDQYRLLKTEVIFICVGTPLINGKFDDSGVTQNLDFLEKNHYKGLVVIKSTFHPSYFTKKYNLNLISNPEFLNANTANADFLNQKLIMIGGRVDLCEILKSIYLDKFNIVTPNFEFVSFEEALIFKYIRNIKIGYDVIFWEFVQESTGNYRKYKLLLDKLPININNIRADTEPGFGGSCLPKDTAAYPEHMLTNFMLKYNDVLKDNHV